MSSARARQSLRLILLLAVCLPLAMLLALAVGSVSLNFSELAGTIVGGESNHANMIVSQIRLPRVLLAGLVGAMLGISGAAMQGMFRNPLADPSLIGVTAGAALGASLVIAVGGSWLAAAVSAQRAAGSGRRAAGSRARPRGSRPTL